MQITVLSATIETATNKKGGTYQKLVLAFKDDKGKVQGKTLMDFTAKDVFTTLAASKSGEVFDITTVKEGDYWQWKAAVPSTGASPAPQRGNSVASSPAATKGTWETPEERAKKQVYIIRQSSLNVAVAALSAGVKAPPKADEIIELAKRFEAYVLDTQPEANPVLFDDFDQEIPL